MACTFKSSKCTPNDTPSLTRPCLLILSKWFHPVWTEYPNIQTDKPRGGDFHSNYHRRHSRRKTFLSRRVTIFPQLPLKHIFKDFKFLNYVSLCVFIGIWVCECKYPERPEEGAKSSGTGVTRSCKPPEWVLGTEMRSSGRAICALCYGDFSLAPIKHLNHYIFICVCICVGYGCGWTCMYMCAEVRSWHRVSSPNFSPPWCIVEFSEIAWV